MLDGRLAVRCSLWSSTCRGSALLVVLAACGGGAEPRDGDDPQRDVAPLGSMEADGASPMSPASGVGPNLIVADGWVDQGSNGLGIQGAFFTYQDGTGRSSIAADPSRTQTGYCVSGEAAEVIDENFGSTWGSVAALNLRQEVGSTAAGSYDAAAHGVVGFGFDIVGDTAGVLRFVVKQFATHDGFCVNTVPDCALGCSVQYRIDELTQNCWNPGGAAPDAASLQALEWQIPSSAGAATPFDYCIENIHAVLGEPAAN